MMARHPVLEGLSFASIFIGGGTPTLYDGESLARLLSRCRRRLPFAGEVEISVEMNPNTASYDDLLRLRRAGVNRLSIGVQALDDPLLRAIGRGHTRDAAIEAVALGRRAGFANINIDLMFGLPEQDLRLWRRTLEEALELNLEHLALYELTVEEGTPFARRQAAGRLPRPGHDELADMEELALELLGAAGFERYEISNFARPGRWCRHNINYWQNGPYLGLGAGAVSYLDSLRLVNVGDYRRYGALLARGVHPLAEAEGLSTTAAMRESLVMGLRMVGGLSLSELKLRYAIDPRAYYGEIMEQFLARGMLRLEGDILRLSRKALPVANQVLAELV